MQFMYCPNFFNAMKFKNLQIDVLFALSFITFVSITLLIAFN